MDKELWDDIMDLMSDACARGMPADKVVEKVQRAAAEFEREMKFEAAEGRGYVGQ